MRINIYVLCVMIFLYVLFVILLAIYYTLASRLLVNLLALTCKTYTSKQITGFGVEYLKVSGDGKESNNAFMQDCKSVLNSKQSEESLVSK
jgi:hypothetical protein